MVFDEGGGGSLRWKHWSGFVGSPSGFSVVTLQQESGRSGIWDGR